MVGEQRRPTSRRVSIASWTTEIQTYRDIFGGSGGGVAGGMLEAMVADMSQEQDQSPNACIRATFLCRVLELAVRVLAVST